VQAHDAAINALRDYARILIRAPAGSGKSHIIASLAKTMLGKVDGKVLVLAHRKELIKQNISKMSGVKSTIFSAGAGAKDSSGQVIFGSPVSVRNSIKVFADVKCVILDEAHAITPTFKKIIKSLGDIFVIGLTATDYRMGTGHVYQHHFKYGLLDESSAIKPWFEYLCYDIAHQVLLDDGYILPPLMHESRADRYDTTQLELTKSGKWTGESVRKTFEGRTTKTHYIVRDITERSAGRKGVIIFAASQSHAQEIHEMIDKYYAYGGSRLLIDKVKDHDQIIDGFKRQNFKYLVNVDMATTGFDAPHVDVIALMRRSESPGLVEQMCGRGARPYGCQKNYLLLDYAQNIENLFYQSNIYRPIISTKKSEIGERKEYHCPKCSGINSYVIKRNPYGYDETLEGYFTYHGEVVNDMYGKPEVSHYGRKCAHECGFFYVSKNCKSCGEINDIAARVCSKCEGRLVDPNSKLVTDPNNCHRVIDMGAEEYVSKSGNVTIKLTFTIARKKIFSKYLMPFSTSNKYAWASKNFISKIKPGFYFNFGSNQAIILMLNSVDITNKHLYISLAKQEGKNYMSVDTVFYDEF